ncbi:MAG: tRNA-dihydrouridine synthase family protein [Kiritimatiellae bacterium]|nr:tRNA-dihydrouridine synthase family protein [Kiritimatiellia bacterium]
MHARFHVKYVLAPLAGFTSAPFRLVCRQRGADLVYTEMVSAAGIAHGSSPTRQLMEVMPGEGPVGCQLFGSNPDELAVTAAEADKLNRFVEINLNAGCPMPKIVHEGAGAALIPDPQKIHDCLVAIKRETHLPVTLKTRPGPRPDDVKLFELLDAAETAGCAGFTLHGRFTSQMHGGPVHYDLLAELVQRAHVPITGNGGVYNSETAERMAETGVAAIMVARAALANPWLFSDLRNPESAEVLEAPVRRRVLQNAAFKDHLANLYAFREQLVRNFPDDHIPGVDGFISVILHTHLFRYFNGRPGSAELRRRLTTIRTVAEVVDAVSPFFEETAVGQTDFPSI